MFADDTNLVIEGPNIDELKEIVDRELIILEQISLNLTLNKQR